LAGNYPNPLIAGGAIGPSEISSVNASQITDLTTILDIISFQRFPKFSSFPSPGLENVIYYADDTGYTWYYSNGLGDYFNFNQFQQYKNFADFPATGVVGIIYCEWSLNLCWRWDDQTSVYIQITFGPPSVYLPPVATIIELNFGSIPTSEKDFLINDPNVNPASELKFEVVNYLTPTGKMADSQQAETFYCCITVINNGSYNVTIRSLEGPVFGAFLFKYTIAY
jgi:hypothetical protein